MEINSARVEARQAGRQTDRQTDRRDITNENRRKV